MYSMPFFFPERVCEGKGPMSLKCNKGRTIKIVSAMYGRRKKKVCPGPNDNKTNCKGSGNTLKKVRARCNGKKSCKIPATNGEFGDPCGGIYKYLEVKYACRKGTFVNNISRPYLSNVLY